MLENDRYSSPQEREDRLKRAAAMFMQHYPLVRHIALVSAPRPHLRDDIVNDAFITFVEGADKWDLEKPIKPLIRKIVIRSAAVYWRKQIEHLPPAMAELSESIRQELLLMNPISVNSDLDKELNALLHCLDQLTPRCQELFEKHYYQRIAITDIARMTGQSLAALYKLFLRAKVQLKKCVENTLRGREKS